MGGLSLLKGWCFDHTLISGRISNVFYQQYLTVLPEGIFTLALCFVPTFVVCYLLLGLDIRSGILNLLSIIMILVDTIGLMAVWGISYNAVSLINLVTVTCRIGHRWPLAAGIWAHKLPPALCGI